MVLKAARLQMKQYMGECRFLFSMTASTTSKFSARLTIPTVKKMRKGTFTSGQSVRFTELVFMTSKLELKELDQIVKKDNVFEKLEHF